MNVWFILFNYSGTKKQPFKKFNWPTDCKIMTPWNICSIIEIKGHNDNYQCDMIWFDFGNRLETDCVKFDYVKFNCHFLFFCYRLKTDYVQVNCHFLSFVPSFTDQSWPSNPFVSWLTKFLIFPRFFSCFTEVEKVKKWHF